MSKTTANPLEDVEIGTPTKPHLVMFFVIDCSGSMSIEGRMNSVNHAIREAIPVLKRIDGQDSDIKIAVLQFSNGARWMYNNLVDVQDFAWNDLEAFGITDFGEACNELCNKLSRKQFMKSKTGYRKPVIILLSDGEPNDDWEKALERLKTNKWFKLSYKIAIAVEGADTDIMEKFTGEVNSVYSVSDAARLKDLFKVVAITSGEIGSQSMPIDDNSAKSESDVEDAAQQALNDAIDNNLYADSSDDDDEWDDED